MPERRTPLTDATMPWPIAVIFPLLAVLLLLFQVLPGLEWGLPSARRNRLTLGPEPRTWRAPDVSSDEIEAPWVHYPNYLPGGPQRTGRLPRSAFNPLRSYHPDEYVIIKSLSSMNPRRLRFFHGFFGWPAFHFYVVGGALEVSSWLGWVEVERDLDLYFREPALMARAYKIGRIVTLLFAAGCIILVWRIASRLCSRGAGAAAAMLLAVTPLFTINAHYMTADVPMLFWILLTVLAASHILAGGGRRWYVLAGVFLGLAAGTRYQGVLAAVAVLCAHLLQENQDHPSRTGRLARLADRLKSKDLWLAALLSAVVFLLVNPYILLRPGQFLSEFAGELRSSRSPLGFLACTALSLQAALGIFLSGATLLALWMAATLRGRNALFILFSFGIPAAVLWIGRPVMARYYMPALPLPVLLAAWAFSRIRRRGLTLGKPRTILAAPLLFLAVLVATAHQSFAYCALFADPNADTRTRAGQWIARNIPKGAAIGVVSVPWQFELPPLNDKDYKIVVVGQNLDALARAAPDYFVSSDLQFPPIAVRDPLNQSEKAFRAAVFEGSGPYAVAERVEAWPAGYEAFLHHGPHDMRYTNPVVVISSRVSRSRPDLRTP